MARLKAVKHISSRLPKGSRFETPDREAHVLVALGVAKPVDDEPRPSGRRRRGRQSEPAA